MARYVVLAQSRITAAALAAIPALFGDKAPRGEEGRKELEVLVDLDQARIDDGIDLFATIARRLLQASGSDERGASAERVVILVDSVRPAGLDPVAEGTTWESLLARLILALPELYWVFGVVEGGSGLNSEADDQEEFSEIFREHDLTALLQRPARPVLLDATGLRNFVRQQANRSLRGREWRRVVSSVLPTFQLPIRSSRAAAIDEEVDYALLHGYAAYRFGFRADLVTTWRLMKSLFGEQAAQNHGYQLLIEDVRLRFPDKPNDVHLSTLPTYFIEKEPNGREHHCPLLSNARDVSSWRILVTTGQSSPKEEVVAINDAYLSQKPNGRGRTLFKPVGGVFDLWHDAGLLEELDERLCEGYAKGFNWPPEALEDHWSGRHAAPGQLTMIAAYLIDRAAGLRMRTATLADSIRAAVLASDAVELIGGRTPALTLSGLALKHEMEVRAECAFVGAGFHFEVGRRLKAIEAEVSSVSEWFVDDRRQHAALDARAGIVNRLVLVYREAGQAEEMDECLAVLRSVNRKMRRPKSWSPLAWLAHGVLAYGELLMTSFPRVLIAIGAWLAAFCFSARVFDHEGQNNWIAAAGKAFTWFFGGETANASSDAVAVALVAIPIGILHIGILISYLYSLIARK
jgi:hypothetical protein